MRHFLLTLLTILLTTTAVAQKNLEIGKLFDGRFHKAKAVMETHIKGAKLEQYSLDEYHSLTFKDDAHTATVENAVLLDAKKAAKKEVSYVSGHLYFGFYVFPQKNDEFQYIFYLNSRLKGKDSVTLIYMMGEAEPHKVKEMLKNK